MDDDKKLDPFDVPFIMAFIIAFFGDVSFFLILPHYFAAFIITAIVWPRFKGWLPKLNFALCILLPLPVLMIGLVQGVLLSNAFIASLAEQVAIQGIAALTGGAGEALEGVALAEEAAEVGELAAEAGEAAGAAGEAGTAAAEGGASAGTEAAEGGAETAGESENSKPSEESTERGSEAEEKEEKKRNRRSNQNNRSDEDENDEDETEESEEQRQAEDAEARYQELTESEAEESPIEVAKRKYFSEQEAMPGGTQAAEEPSKAPKKENESTRRLSERFEKALRTKQELEKLKRPQAATDDNNNDADDGDNQLRRAA